MAIWKTYGHFSVDFFRYKYKQFYEFSITKLLANIRDFDIFRKNLNLKRS